MEEGRGSRERSRVQHAAGADWPMLQKSHPPVVELVQVQRHNRSHNFFSISIMTLTGC